MNVYAKALVAALVAACGIVVTGVATGSWQWTVASVVLGVLNTLGVYRVPNASPDAAEGETP